MSANNGTRKNSQPTNVVSGFLNGLWAAPAKKANTPELTTNAKPSIVANVTGVANEAPGVWSPRPNGTIGGKRASRKANRKNRKASRKANRKNRKASRKANRKDRKASRKANRKNRK